MDSSLSPSTKSVITTQTSYKDGIYGVPNTMIYGSVCIRDGIIGSHPLASSEKKYDENRACMDYDLLKRIQGVHAPMRLIMERKAASMVGRLPFLPSSNAMFEALVGTDESIGFEDIFNTPANCEGMIDPHLAMEKSYGSI